MQSNTIFKSLPEALLFTKKNHLVSLFYKKEIPFRRPFQLLLYALLYIRPIAYNCTIFLCFLDVGNIDDHCRGPSIKEKGHLAG